MSIWIYNDKVRDTDAVLFAVKLESCAFCQATMETPKSESSSEVKSRGERPTHESFTVRCCPVCGWWTAYKSVTKQFYGTDNIIIKEFEYGATGSLQELDLSDQTLPIEEIRAYLAAKYDARFQIDPWKFEETVASVYKDLGYCARVTARSGDDGIDVILDGPDNTMIGVQVKRYKGKINVEQIRSLAGSLQLNKLTRGIFVTTSSFQSGAYSTAERFGLTGTAIELVDAQRFYDALGFAQRKAYETMSDPTAPYSSIELGFLRSME